MSFPRLQRIDHRFKWVTESASWRNSQIEDSSGPMHARFCSLQRLAQEQSRIVYGVHESRSCGGSRFDSDPSKRSPRGHEAKPLHESVDWMECGEKCSRGCDSDSRSSRAGNDRKQHVVQRFMSPALPARDASHDLGLRRWRVACAPRWLFACRRSHSTSAYPSLSEPRFHTWNHGAKAHDLYN